MNPLFARPDFINQSIISLFHILFVIVGILYLVFALLVIRQIDLMNKTLTTKFSTFATTLGIVHLGISILMLWFFATAL